MNLLRNSLLAAVFCVGPILPPNKRLLNMHTAGILLAYHSQILTNHSVAFKFRWLSSRGFQMIKTFRSSQTRAKWYAKKSFRA